jgi:hypothetical protein
MGRSGGICRQSKMTLTHKNPFSMVPTPLQASIAQRRNETPGGGQWWDQSKRFAIPDPPAERESSDEVGLVLGRHRWLADRRGLREPATLRLL